MKTETIFLDGGELVFKDKRAVCVGTEKDNPDSDFFFIFKRPVNDGDRKMVEEHKTNVFDTPSARVTVNEDLVVTELRLSLDISEAMHYLISNKLCQK